MCAPDLNNYLWAHSLLTAFILRCWAGSWSQEQFCRCAAAHCSRAHLQKEERSTFLFLLIRRDENPLHQCLIMKSCFATFYVLKWEQYLQNNLWLQYEKLLLLKYSTASEVLEKTLIRDFFAGFPSLRSATKDQNTLAGLLHWNKAKMQVSVTNYKDDINSLSQN